jgi:hypothetical protein
MRQGKRNSLVRKDWTLGSAEDFLGLTPAERACIDLRLMLTDETRSQLRSKVATGCGRTTTSISKR